MSSAARELVRILVVDDNHDVADSLARLLRKWGFEPRLAYDGRQALEAARQFRPACILSDIGLPEIDGYDLAQQLRRDPDLQSIPLVAISAYNEPQRAAAAGYDAHLLKPADPLELQTLLRRLLAMDERLEEAEERVQQQGEVLTEAIDVMREVQQDVKEIKNDLKEVQEDVKEVQEDVKQIKKELQDGT